MRTWNVTTQSNILKFWQQMNNCLQQRPILCILYIEFWYSFKGGTYTLWDAWNSPPKVSNFTVEVNCVHKYFRHWWPQMTFDQNNKIWTCVYTQNLRCIYSVSCLQGFQTIFSLTSHDLSIPQKQVILILPWACLKRGIPIPICMN